MIEITKVKNEPYDSCNACYPAKMKKAKSSYHVRFHHNSHQSTVVRLCKECLNDLGCLIADTLDPVPKKKAKKKALKVGVYLSEEAMDSGNIMAPRER